MVPFGKFFLFVVVFVCVVGKGFKLNICTYILIQLVQTYRYMLGEVVIKKLLYFGKHCYHFTITKVLSDLLSLFQFLTHIFPYKGFKRHVLRCLSLVFDNLENHQSRISAEDGVRETLVGRVWWKGAVTLYLGSGYSPHHSLTESKRCPVISFVILKCMTRQVY